MPNVGIHDLGIAGVAPILSLVVWGGVAECDGVPSEIGVNMVLLRCGGQSPIINVPHPLIEARSLEANLHHLGRQL